MPGDTTLVIYNSARASTQLPGYLGRRRLAGVRPLADWWRGGPLQPLACLHGRALTAAAGLAQPEPFFAMLREQGLSITTLPLPDHFAFESLPWLERVGGVNNWGVALAIAVFLMSSYAAMMA